MDIVFNGRPLAPRCIFKALAANVVNVRDIFDVVKEIHLRCLPC